MSPDGYPYEAGTPRWVPLIDACIANGGKRSDCIEGLPVQEYERFLTWEREHRRRQLLEIRRRLNSS
jgi:hypothetical protein